MAKAPSVTRLTVEDFQEQAGWIDKLLQPLNTFMGDVYTALAKGLTVSDNQDATIRTTQVVFPLTYPIRISNPNASSPAALIVCKVVEKDKDYPTLTGPVYCDWAYADGVIKINNVYGLNTTAGKIYYLSLYIIGG